jgi:D-glycero-D-manno-heptose 1,7-bisphosphate phosphatase
MKLRRALFLDRDGVVNVDRGYVHRPEDIEFVDGIFDLCRAARQLGHLIFIVTNQAGIGRGYFTEQDFQRLSAWMCTVFENEGGPIDRVYFSPYHPEHGIGSYKIDSPMRKPGPGMILQATKEFGVHLAGSVSVGDKESDVEAGIAAGVGQNLLYCPSMTARPAHSAADAILGSLAEVVPFLQRASDAA